MGDRDEPGCWTTDRICQALRDIEYELGVDAVNATHLAGYQFVARAADKIRSLRIGIRGYSAEKDRAPQPGDFDPLAVDADWDSNEDIAYKVAEAARRHYQTRPDERGGELTDREKRIEEAARAYVKGTASGHTSVEAGRLFDALVNALNAPAEPAPAPAPPLQVERERDRLFTETDVLTARVADLRVENDRLRAEAKKRGEEVTRWMDRYDAARRDLAAAVALLRDSQWYVANYRHVSLDDAKERQRVLVALNAFLAQQNNEVADA